MKFAIWNVTCKMRDVICKIWLENCDEWNMAWVILHLKIHSVNDFTPRFHVMYNNLFTLAFFPSYQQSFVTLFSPLSYPPLYTLSEILYHSLINPLSLFNLLSQFSAILSPLFYHLLTNNYMFYLSIHSPSQGHFKP